MSEPATSSFVPVDGVIEADPESELVRLAAMPEVEYQAARKGAAKAMGMQVAFLDSERRRRQPQTTGDNKQGRSLTFNDPEPWPEPVQGGAALDELANAIGDYVILGDHQADACALWVAATWLGERSYFAPRLAITSAEKGCGKTTLLEVLAAVSKLPLSTGGISAAAIARVVESSAPTLFIDEADTFLKDNEDLRGVLNAGHRRGGQVIKCVGEDFEPRAFNVFGFAAIAAIGKLPATIEDRSIRIEMRRAMRDQRPARFNQRAIQKLRTIAGKVRRFIEDNAEGIADADPALPDAMHNRAGDNWRAMFAIASAAGGDWPGRCERAALALACTPNEAAESVGVKALADTKTIFEARGLDRLSSADLCAALAEREDRPWPEWSHGKPITPTQLAKLLRPYKITSATIRIGVGTAKGYLADQFADAWARYLSSHAPETPSQPSHRHNPQKSAENPALRAVTLTKAVTPLDPVNSAENRQSYGVTAEMPPTACEGEDRCANCGGPANGDGARPIGIDGEWICSHRCHTDLIAKRKALAARAIDAAHLEPERMHTDE